MFTVYSTDDPTDRKHRYEVSDEETALLLTTLHRTHSYVPAHVFPEVVTDFYNALMREYAS